MATHQNRPTTTGLVRLATALQDRWHTLADGCARGEVSLDQARVIAHALEELPEDLDPAQVDLAEKTLTTYAAEHDPATLKILGRRILEVVAPHQADAYEQAKLEAEEARARDTQRLTLTSTATAAPTCAPPCPKPRPRCSRRRSTRWPHHATARRSRTPPRTATTPHRSTGWCPAPPPSASVPRSAP